MSANGRAVVNWRRRTKQRAFVYKGSRCLVCGYTRCLGALQFHHIDPGNKDFRISSVLRAWGRVKQELDNCALLCANCHAEFHHGTLDLTPHMHKNPTPQEGDRLLTLAGLYCRVPRRGPLPTCVDCGATISRFGTRCRSCASKKNNPTKIEWPDTEELLQMIAASSRFAVSKQLGVSETAVRKRLRNHPVKTEFLEDTGPAA